MPPLQSRGNIRAMSPQDAEPEQESFTGPMETVIDEFRYTDSEWESKTRKTRWVEGD